MIQISKQNPGSNVFQEHPIVVKSKYSVTSFISSINKKFLGIYYHYFYKSCFNKSNGQFRIFVKKKQKWVEFYKMENSKGGRIQLLCFADNDNQLLFHRQNENCIESLTVNQNQLFGVISYTSRTIEVFIKFPFIPSKIIQSKDQKNILIYDNVNFKHYLLDVIQKTMVIAVCDTQDNNYQDLNFFDNSYLAYTKILKQQQLQQTYQKEIGRKKMFHNIKTKKVEKILYLCKNTYLEDLLYEIDISNLIFKNLGFFCYRNLKNRAIVLLKLNMVNLKFIRKMKLALENPENSDIDLVEFIGISQRYSLYRFFINNKIRLNIMDLFNLNVETFDIAPQQDIYENYDYCKKVFDNQVLKVEDQKLQQAQFWLTK